MHKNDTCKGFTLPELLVSISVLGILLTTAVPAMNSFVKNNRITARVNSVMESVHYARSEATKRGTRVIICRSADPTLATPTCSGTANTWTTGYIIFADDGNNTNNVFDTGTDTLLRAGSPGIADVALLTNGVMDNNLEFNPDGTTNEAGNTAIMAICDDRGTSHGRQITIPPSGIPRMISGSIADCSP
mgnify:CR=1 FL=1